MMRYLKLSLRFNKVNFFLFDIFIVIIFLSFYKTHPGGPDIIFKYAGKDATKAFDLVGHV